MKLPMNLPMYLQPKPAFRAALDDNHRPRVNWRTLQWLYQECDVYTPIPESWFEPEDAPYDIENGDCWCYRFMFWKDARQTMYLNFHSYGDYALWCSFTVNDESVRAAPIDRLNAFELCRRARDVVSRVYRFMYEHEPEADQMLVLSTLEDKDGLGNQRRFVYEKFFILDRITGWVNRDDNTEVYEPEDDTPMYALIPLELIGEIFYQNQETELDTGSDPVSSPEKAAA